jgi:hypothetical protein
MLSQYRWSNVTADPNGFESPRIVLNRPRSTDSVLVSLQIELPPVEAVYSLNVRLYDPSGFGVPAVSVRIPWYESRRGIWASAAPAQRLQMNTATTKRMMDFMTTSVDLSEENSPASACSPAAYARLHTRGPVPSFGALSTVVDMEEEGVGKAVPDAGRRREGKHSMVMAGFSDVLAAETEQEIMIQPEFTGPNHATGN